MEFGAGQTKKKRPRLLIDGIVLKVNNRSYQEELGYTGKIAIAFWYCF